MNNMQEEKSEKDKNVCINLNLKRKSKSKDENIGNHGYIRYIGEISMDILKKNFGKQKIDQNSWKCKKTLY